MLRVEGLASLMTGSESCIRDMVSCALIGVVSPTSQRHADNTTDGPADTLESDSKLQPGQNPGLGTESPGNK